MTILKCPNCGARIPAGALSCLDCGFVFEHESESSALIRNSVNELRDSLLSANNDEQKIIIIETFSMPKTQQALIELIDFAYSNFRTSNGHVSEALTNAWLTKAKQAYDKLQRDSSHSREVDAVIEKYSFLREGSNDKRLKVMASEKERRTHKLVIIGSIILSIIILVFLFLVIVSNVDEEPLPSLDDKIIEYVNAGDFDSARKAAKEAEFPWEERTYQDQILEAEISTLVSEDKINEALIKAGNFNDDDKRTEWTKRLQVILNEK